MTPDRDPGVVNTRAELRSAVVHLLLAHKSATSAFSSGILDSYRKYYSYTIRKAEEEASIAGNSSIRGYEYIRIVEVIQRITTAT